MMGAGHAKRTRADDAHALEVEVPGRLPVPAPGLARLPRAGARQRARPRRTQAIFDQGHEVGRLAHGLFPGGVLVTEEPWQHGEAIERTRALLADPSVPAIFEAAFEHDGVRIRADVLERLAGGGFGLREVKASSRAEAGAPRRLRACSSTCSRAAACASTRWSSST